LVDDSGYADQSLFTATDQTYRVRLGDNQTDHVIEGGHLLGTPANGGLFDDSLYDQEGNVTLENLTLTLTASELVADGIDATATHSYRFAGAGLPLNSNPLDVVETTVVLGEPVNTTIQAALPPDVLFQQLDAYLNRTTQRLEQHQQQLGRHTDLIRVNKQHAQTIIDNASGWLIATLDQPNTAEEAAIQQAAALRSELATQSVAGFAALKSSLLASLFN
ncbi:MAG: hypothetical protein K0U36_07230, partial [Alphaproteobacteria bacterium]|nr:hypothetical protein [Alphaproteobacteria bacterium]